MIPRTGLNSFPQYLQRKYQGTKLQIKKPPDFFQEYWIVTFEAGLVALFTATLALVGVYNLLILPVGLQFLAVFLLLRYKKLKKETEEAIAINTVDSQKRNPNDPIDALREEEKRKYYETNEITNRLRGYHIVASLFLVVSIFFVGLFPFVKEEQKETSNELRNRTIVMKIDSSRYELFSLQEKFDSLEIYYSQILRKDSLPNRTKGVKIKRPSWDKSDSSTIYH